MKIDNISPNAQALIAADELRAPAAAPPPGSLGDALLKSRQGANGPTIDDSQTSAATLWSSQKIDDKVVAEVVPPAIRYPGKMYITGRGYATGGYGPGSVGSEKIIEYTDPPTNNTLGIEWSNTVNGFVISEPSIYDIDWTIGCSQYQNTNIGVFLTPEQWGRMYASIWKNYGTPQQKLLAMRTEGGYKNNGFALQLHLSTCDYFQQGDTLNFSVRYEKYIDATVSNLGEGNLSIDKLYE